MTIEIRPIERAEVRSYLQVLPYVNGLPHWEERRQPPGHERRSVAAAPSSGKRCAARLAFAESGCVRRDRFFPQAAFVDGRIVVGSAIPVQFTILLPSASGFFLFRF
ncbi:hypothetical protein GCM10020218_062580 [Dactylosporangium vinaceum]